MAKSARPRHPNKEIEAAIRDAEVSKFTRFYANEIRFMPTETAIPQKVHSVTLLYQGPDEMTEEMADKLFGCGCDDAIVGQQNGFLVVAFAREAPSYREALLSAIETVEKAELPMNLVEIESDFVTREQRRASLRVENAVSLDVHHFSLLYVGADEMTEDMANRLFEVGCDDALVGYQNGFIFLDFAREAPSFKESLLSAIATVESAGLPIRLARVEPT